MPRGRYSLHDPHDHTPFAEEHFQCAPGPSGWRYVSRLTDPAGDHRGAGELATEETRRPSQPEPPTGGWTVRGADPEGVTWVRTDPTGTHATEGNVRAHAFTGTSPAFLIATARLLRLTPSSAATRVLT